MIEFNCPECNKQIKVKPELAGRIGKCPGCGNKILVPQASALTKVETPKPVIVRPQSAAKPVVRPPEVPQPIQRWSLPQQVRPQPTTAIQVNVNNTKATNSLGISSLVLGILSFFVCWIPVIGFGLSGLGLLLGLGGIAMSVFRKGTGIGYSIAGAAVNSITLFIGIIFITVYASAVASVDSTMKQLEAERNKVAQQAKPVQPQQAMPAPTSSDATGEAPTTPEVATPEAPVEEFKLPKDRYGLSEYIALCATDMVLRGNGGMVGGRNAMDPDKMSSLIEIAIAKSTMTDAGKATARKKASKIIDEFKFTKWFPGNINLSRLDKHVMGVVASKDFGSIDIGLGPEQALPSPSNIDFLPITILQIVSDNSFLAMSVKDFDTSTFLVEGMPTKRLGVGGKVTIPRLAISEDPKKVDGVPRPVLHVFDEKEHAAIMEYCTKNADELIKWFEESKK